MAAVLQPLNVKAADIIVNHVDLLQTPYIDPLLLQVCPCCSKCSGVHCAGYAGCCCGWQRRTVRHCLSPEPPRSC
jgi:hypothetical protein